MGNLLFDYRSLVKKLTIPPEIVQKLEEEARDEFPFDNMLMEIHVLRAIKAYSKTTSQVIPVEN